MKLLVIYLVIVNIVAIIMYGLDKSRARKREWRISEAKLIGVALSGGSVGAYLGMCLFRHKTKHIKFSIGLPVIIILQTIILWNFITLYTN